MAMSERPNPDRRLSTTFIATRIDGALLPHIIDEEVYFNPPKDRYDELDEQDLPFGIPQNRAGLEQVADFLVRGLPFPQAAEDPEGYHAVCCFPSARLWIKDLVAEP